jgi:aminoglycoside phosphotransferase
MYYVYCVHFLSATVEYVAQTADYDEERFLCIDVNHGSCSIVLNISNKAKKVVDLILTSLRRHHPSLSSS